MVQPPTPPAAPPPMPPAGTPPPVPPTGPAPYSVGPDPDVKSAENKALIGMILGIAALVTCLCFLGIPALILGNGALAVLDRPGVVSSARGQAVAARILGIIATIFFAFQVIGTVIWFIVVVAAVGSGATAPTTP